MTEPNDISTDDEPRSYLASLWPSGAKVAADSGGRSAFLLGLPVAGHAVDLDGAVNDLIEALHDYANDWDDHLNDAPNHRVGRSAVTLIHMSTDEQLRA